MQSTVYSVHHFNGFWTGSSMSIGSLDNDYYLQMSKSQFIAFKSVAALWQCPPTPLVHWQLFIWRFQFQMSGDSNWITVKCSLFPQNHGNIGFVIGLQYFLHVFTIYYTWIKRCRIYSLNIWLIREYYFLLWTFDLQFKHRMNELPETPKLVWRMARISMVVEY